MKGRTTGMAALAATVLLGAPGLAAQEAVEVPLRMVEGRLLVPVDIGGGIEADFILSTGNTVTVLSEDFVANHGADGDFRLGGVPVRLDGHATVPHDRLQAGDAMVAGIVGANSLNRYDLLIDVPGGVLRMKPARRAVEWPGTALSDPVRLRIYHGLVIGLDVTVNGTEYPAMLDTGTGGLLANPPVAEGLGLDGGSTVRLGLGASTLEGIVLRTEDLPVMTRFDPSGNGFVLVGSAIAADCAISVSWVHQELRVCAR